MMPIHRVLSALWVLGTLGLLSCNNGLQAGGPPADMASPPPDLTPSIFSDFPSGPVVDTGLPANLPALFGQAPQGMAAGPCMTEPTMNAMVPRNWTPLYFEWTGGSLNVFELRLHVDNQTNDLVVYTGNANYTLPAATWTALAAHSGGHDVVVTLRGATLQGMALTQGPAAGTSGTVHIAPVAALGSVVYWTTSNGTALNGFHIGDTTVTTVVTPQLMNDGTGCVGCHYSSPDGALIFLSKGPQPTGGPFTVDARLVDGTAREATSVSANALALLGRPDQALPTLSAAHYTAQDSVVLTVLNDTSQNQITNGRFEIIWTDLLAQSGGSGILSRMGDSNQAATPAFSHDGTTVAYTSTASVADGRPGSGPADIYTVPYGNRQGGPATPLNGASTPDHSEYYPIYSPGDAFVAFNRTPANGNMYNEPTAEVFVVPSGGGTATRIAGNDPNSCTGLTSPGLTNSWPRWAPDATQSGTETYYWLVFSSTRRGDHPQLFVTAVVTSTDPKQPALSTYPAVWVTTQPAAESNHTPAWDNFQIPLG